MALTSSASVALNGVQTNPLDLATPAMDLKIRDATGWSTGTGAGKADRIFSDRRTLAASASEDLDLAGVLVDAFGATITFARIKGLYIAASAANTNNVIVGNATSNAWATLLGATHTLTLRPGTSICLVTGVADATCYAVTAGTGDQLKILNSGGSTSVTYDIGIIGCSA